MRGPARRRQPSLDQALADLVAAANPDVFR